MASFGRHRRRWRNGAPIMRRKRCMEAGSRGRICLADRLWHKVESILEQCMGNGKATRDRPPTHAFTLDRQSSWTDSASTSDSLSSGDHECGERNVTSTPDTLSEIRRYDDGRGGKINGRQGEDDDILGRQQNTTLVVATESREVLSGAPGSQCSLCGYTLENGQHVLMAPSCMEGIKVRKCLLGCVCARL